MLSSPCNHQLAATPVPPQSPLPPSSLPPRSGLELPTPLRPNPPPSSAPMPHHPPPSPPFSSPTRATYPHLRAAIIHLPSTYPPFFPQPPNPTSAQSPQAAAPTNPVRLSPSPTLISSTTTPSAWPLLAGQPSPTPLAPLDQPPTLVSARLSLDPSRNSRTPLPPEPPKSPPPLQPPRHLTASHAASFNAAYTFTVEPAATRHRGHRIDSPPPLRSYVAAHVAERHRHPPRSVRPAPAPLLVPLLATIRYSSLPPLLRSAASSSIADVTIQRHKSEEDLLRASPNNEH